MFQSCEKGTFSASADIISDTVPKCSSYQSDDRLELWQIRNLQCDFKRSTIDPCSCPSTESGWDVLTLFLKKSFVFASLERIHHLQWRSRGQRTISLESYKISPSIFLPPHCGSWGLHWRTLLLQSGFPSGAEQEIKGRIHTQRSSD